MTLQQAHRQLSSQLHEIYEEREASNIADIVIEYISGIKKIDRVLNRQIELSTQQEHTLVACTEKLIQHMPVQYVLHEAWFAGMKLYVDENVLIPRPETEELIEWIVGDLRSNIHPASRAGRHSTSRIIDIGTGSGCIAIALKKQMPAVEMYACDISDPALNIARKNAEANKTEINFFKIDILDERPVKNMPAFNVIVSNPPYVKRSEAEDMRTNVFLYEPHLALFVADENPLLFHEHICNFALSCLEPGGNLYLEINENSGKDVVVLLQSKGFSSVELKKDLQGKDRFVKAVYLPAGN